MVASILIAYSLLSLISLRLLILDDSEMLDFIILNLKMAFEDSFIFGLMYFFYVVVVLPTFIPKTILSLISNRKWKNRN